MKSKSQLRYEARLREQKRQLRARGIAHPAAPAGHAGMWHAVCERDGCGVVFVTSSRQRRYCSAKCQRMAERRKAYLRMMRENAVLRVCDYKPCSEVFIPNRITHRFHSVQCRQKGYRLAGDLSSKQCAWCGTSIVGRTARAKFCTDNCRVAASRSRKDNN